MSLNFKYPAGQDLSSKTIKIVGYFMATFGVLGLGQGLFIEKEKSYIGIAGTLFLAMLGLYQIFSHNLIFNNRKIALINILNLLFIDAFLYALAMVNLAGGLFALPIIIALYTPTFVLLRDYRKTPKTKVRISNKLKYTQYTYLIATIILILTVFLDSVSSQFK